LTDMLPIAVISSTGVIDASIFFIGGPTRNGPHLSATDLLHAHHRLRC
jgi:hypothetical protein